MGLDIAPVVRQIKNDDCRLSADQWLDKELQFLFLSLCNLCDNVTKLET